MNKIEVYHLGKFGLRCAVSFGGIDYVLSVQDWNDLAHRIIDKTTPHLTSAGIIHSDMETIIEALEKQIPKGNWCNNGGTSAGWCPYLVAKEGARNAKGEVVLGYYCNLMEEFIRRKECGINEDL